MKKNNDKPPRKIVLISGASTGIGRSIAENLASNGDYVYAGARRDEDIKILNSISNIKGVKLDITQNDDIKKIIDLINSEEGKLDVLINNAGIATGGPLVEYSEQELKKIFDVNVFGMYRLTKASYALLKKSDFNAIIINISSTAARHALPFFGPYAMTKFAVEAYSDSLRRELDPLGINVIVIQPGRVKTPIWEKSEELLSNFKNSEFSERAYPLVENAIENGKLNGQNPNIIAETVFKAVHKKDPKIRYHLPNGWLRSIVLDKFPDKIVDWIIRKK